MTSASTSSSVAEPVDPRAERAAANRETLRALPVRQLPAPQEEWVLHGEAPAGGQPLVLLHQIAVLQIAAHSSSNTDCELGGALLGQAYRHGDQLVVEVKAALPAASDDHGPVHFTFTADSWSRLQRDRAQHYASLDIVGWFHTHPDLGVFYSSDDVVVHKAAFTLPWHIGMVIDPLRGEAACFGWVDGELEPLPGYFELRDRQPESLVPWMAVRTAIWDHPYYDHSASAVAEQRRPDPSEIYVPYNSRAGYGLAGRESLWLAAGAGLVLGLMLLAGMLVTLRQQVAVLEATALSLAEGALAETNALTCPDPRVRILSPVTGQTYMADGTIPIVGTADYPDAVRYQIDIRPAGAGQWALLDQPRNSTTLGLLTSWEAAGFAAGAYELRLHAVDSNNVTLASSNPCLVAVTLTPGAAP